MFLKCQRLNKYKNYLVEQNKIIRIGEGRSTKYILNTSKLLDYYDIEAYFREDYRTDIIEHFNMDIFSDLKDIFQEEELSLIEEINHLYKNKILGQTKTGIQKEFERLTIEFSWKSSSIEGNTYTLLDTERLLKENIKASGHNDDEAQMILNHKEAMDFILSNPNYFEDISFVKIKELHQILTRNLSIKSGIRKSMVGITGTNYRPLDNEFSITDVLEKLVINLNKNLNPVEKALVAVSMISYIQPFEDGNKRTARMLGNALLIAHQLIPVSFVGVNNLEYKKAIILFYEKNSILYLKQLFLEQYQLSVNKYF